MSEIHKRYLLIAHSLAYRNFGKTFPNPSVGCLIIKNNKIISKSVTAPAGRPHAEEIALKKTWITKKTVKNAIKFYGKCEHKIHNNKLLTPHIIIQLQTYFPKFF